jgi:MarR family transcriptional regulator, organic hydroperoxide resistance regulator
MTSKKKPLPSRHAGPQESLGFLLWKVSNAWQRRQRAALKPLELTHSQFVLLATATWFAADQALTQARLAELSGVDAMTTSQLVRTLEAAGLMERPAHPGDPRARAIVVTAAGRARVKKAIVVVEDTDAAFFDEVAGKSGKLLDLLRALDAPDA